MNSKMLLPMGMLALSLGLACDSNRKAAPTPQPPVQVQVVNPEGSGTGWVAASLEARDQAVLASRFGATVKAVLVREGEPVKAGQLLAQLDDGDLRGARDSARAGLYAAQAQQSRIQRLFAQQAATQAELDQANAQLAQAQAAMSGSQANLRYTELRSPFLGTVRSRTVDPGAFVGPGQPILTVDGGGLELKASLTDGEASGLKVGQGLEFEAEEQWGKARITALAAGADPLTHRRDLRATVISPTGLRGGSFARIQLRNPSEATSLWMPESALVRRGGLTGVFVVEDGHAVLRWLSLGEQQRDRVEVLAGLKASDAVVDQPGDLRDGQAVEFTHGR